MMKKLILILTAISINIALNCKQIIAASVNPDDKKSFLQLESPDVWLYSEVKGVEKYNIRKNIFEKFDINGNDLLKIIKTENDHLIISKYEIYKLDGKTKEIAGMANEAFLNGKEIECINNVEKGLYAGIKGSIGYYDYNEKRSEEHTSELQSHSFISYAVFCLKKKN